MENAFDLPTSIKSSSWGESNRVSRWNVSSVRKSKLLWGSPGLFQIGHTTSTVQLTKLAFVVTRRTAWVALAGEAAEEPPRPVRVDVDSCRWFEPVVRWATRNTPVVCSLVQFRTLQTGLVLTLCGGLMPNQKMRQPSSLQRGLLWRVRRRRSHCVSCAWMLLSTVDELSAFWWQCCLLSFFFFHKFKTRKDPWKRHWAIAMCRVGTHPDGITPMVRQRMVSRGNRRTRWLYTTRPSSSSMPAVPITGSSMPGTLTRQGVGSACSPSWRICSRRIQSMGHLGSPPETQSS